MAKPETVSTFRDAVTDLRSARPMDRLLRFEGQLDEDGMGFTWLGIRVSPVRDALTMELGVIDEPGGVENVLISYVELNERDQFVGAYGYRLAPGATITDRGNFQPGTSEELAGALALKVTMGLNPENSEQTS